MWCNSNPSRPSWLDDPQNLKQTSCLNWSAVITTKDSLYNAIFGSSWMVKTMGFPYICPWHQPHLAIFTVSPPLVSQGPGPEALVHLPRSPEAAAAGAAPRGSAAGAKRKRCRGHAQQGLGAGDVAEISGGLGWPWDLGMAPRRRSSPELGRELTWLYMTLPPVFAASFGCFLTIPIAGLPKFMPLDGVGRKLGWQEHGKSKVFAGSIESTRMGCCNGANIAVGELLESKPNATKMTGLHTTSNIGKWRGYQPPAIISAGTGGSATCRWLAAGRGTWSPACGAGCGDLQEEVGWKDGCQWLLGPNSGGEHHKTISSQSDEMQLKIFGWGSRQELSPRFDDVSDVRFVQAGDSQLRCHEAMRWPRTWRLTIQNLLRRGTTQRRLICRSLLAWTPTTRGFQTANTYWKQKW